MTPILVTGAPGNVGSEVVRLLREAGQPVRVAARNTAKARADLGEGSEYVTFDFENPATYAGALKGIRKLFLVRPPAIADVKRHINPFLDAARAAGVDHVVFLSLIGANPLVPHYKVEQHLKRIGMPYTFLQPGFFMQNLSTTHREQIRQRREIPLPTGRGRTNFIDCRDLAAVAAKVLMEDGHAFRAYPLTGTEALDYHQVAAIMSRVLGEQVTFTNPSRRDFKRVMVEDGHPPAFANVVANLYLVVRLGLSAKLTNDCERLLGRKPYTMEQFVQDHADVWR